MLLDGKAAKRDGHGSVAELCGALGLRKALRYFLDELAYLVMLQ